MVLRVWPEYETFSGFLEVQQKLILEKHLIDILH